MKTSNALPSFRRMPESSGRLKAPTFGLTTFWIPAAACPGEGQGRNDGKKLTGQQ